MTKRTAAGTPFLDPPEPAERARCAAAVLPVPYDATSTFVKGADRGPAAAIAASAQLEWHDVELDAEPGRLGVWTHTPINHTGPPETLTPAVERVVAEDLDAGVLPVTLGGEHSVSIGAIRAAAAFAERTLQRRLTVLQIDAHADTRDAYEGSRHNHACVMARAREVADVVQIGIRSIDASEKPGLDPLRTLYAHDIHADHAGSWIARVADLVRAKPIYVTFDLDGLDPSLVPCTGTPEPGGLSWTQATACLAAACAEASHVVAADVVELCPTAPWTGPEQDRPPLLPGDHASAFVAAKLIYRLIGLGLRRRGLC